MDDSLLDAEMILQALADSEVSNHAVQVHDGFEALDYLFRRGRFTGRTSAQPELVFLDLHMPKMDGLEVLKHIRSDERFDGMPVVMFSTTRRAEDVACARDLDATQYCEKPVDYD